jgi:hypothetical protein
MRNAHKPRNRRDFLCGGSLITNRQLVMSSGYWIEYRAWHIFGYR